MGGLKWERGEVCEESGEGIRRKAENENARKNSPKTQQIWNLRTPLGGYRPMSYILDSVYLMYRKTLTGSQLSLPHGVSPQKFNVIGIIANTPGGYRSMPYIFRKIFHAQQLPRR